MFCSMLDLTDMESFFEATTMRWLETKTWWVTKVCYFSTMFLCSGRSNAIFFVFVIHLLTISIIFQQRLEILKQEKVSTFRNRMVDK